MTRAKKDEIIKQLAESFKVSEAIVVADFKGTSHKALEELRITAKEAGVSVQVTKNTLANRAIKEAGLEELELTGNSIFLWSDDQITACKVADKFATAHKDTFAIKCGIIEGETADLDRVNAFAKLPGREELLGMLASVWMGPVRNFTIGLDALRQKKEEEAA